MKKNVIEFLMLVVSALAFPPAYAILFVFLCITTFCVFHVVCKTRLIQLCLGYNALQAGQ